jgi:hypothetical protein
MSTEIEVPEEFAKVIKDFVGDLKTTFPEYNSLISKWWKDASNFDYIENTEIDFDNLADLISMAQDYQYQLLMSQLQEEGL